MDEQERGRGEGGEQDEEKQIKTVHVVDAGDHNDTKVDVDAKGMASFSPCD